MPVIFNENNREQIRQKMLDNGYALLKHTGVKRMTVSDIARASGLAKGTFYTFFPSKEEFIYQIILYKRETVREKYESLIAAHGKIGREELTEFFRFIYENDLSIYQYMTEGDMNYLATKWPDAYSFNPRADEDTTKWLMTHMDGIGTDKNWKVVANFMKVLAMMDLSKSNLHADALAETKAVLKTGLLDYLFGPEPPK